jgi:sulfopyruvate decarboxylase subunit beta
MTQRTTHDDVLTRLATLRTDGDVVVATMTAGTLWPAISRHAMDISFHAPMGAASSMGLGIALARPDLGVIVLDSDGAVLMNLGTLVTIGGERPKRFLHVIFENSGYDMTGGQPLPGKGTQPLPALAESLGYARGLRSADPEDLAQAMADMHAGGGPILLAAPVSRDFDMASLQVVANSPEALQRVGKSGFRNLRDQIQLREPAS